MGSSCDLLLRPLVLQCVPASCGVVGINVVVCDLLPSFMKNCCIWWCKFTSFILEYEVHIFLFLSRLYDINTYQYKLLICLLIFSLLWHCYKQNKAKNKEAPCLIHLDCCCCEDGSMLSLWHASVRFTIVYMCVSLPSGLALIDTNFLGQNETSVS